MAIVRRNPPTWAVHMIYLVPSDFVLRDRFGIQVSETTFMAGVESSLLRVRQFYHDMTGGKTFDVEPSTLFRVSKTTAQMYAQDVTWDNAIKAGIAEMAARGYAHIGPNRLILAAIPLDLEGGGIAIAGNDLGSLWFQWGAAIGAGQNPKIFGGMLPDVASGIATIGAAATSSATTLTLSAGGGRILAVAARFGRNKSRVQTVTGAGTSATQMTLNDVGWIGSVPKDAVIWPYGAKPSVANAEAVVITAVNPSTRVITVQRGQKGTTPIAITGGDFNNGGSVIAERMGYARIWRPPSSAEASGAECVYVQSISGDTITVVRNEQDAWFAGNPPAARALMVGDNIVATDAPGGNFYQRIESAQGGIAHELGHNFGMKWWNPTEVTNFQVVENGQVVTRNRQPTELTRKSVDAVQGQDWWEHCPHTPDNPLWVGEWFGIMQPYWDFPFGNVPSAMAKPDEVARFVAGPYLRTQTYPSEATQVGASTFRSAAGAVAPPPVETDTGGGTVYTIQPVILLASNSVPTQTDAELIDNLTTSLEEVQDYYTAQTGLTFAFRAPVVHRHGDTEATHNDDSGYGLFEIATAEAAVPQGVGEDLLYAIFAWYPQPGENANRSGWRGNAWAYANGPCYMSDRGARRLMGEVPDTLVTNSPGTGGTTINISTGTGLRLSRNADVPALPITARVYSAAGSFDNAATYEVVTITNIVGDVLTVTRAGAPRSIAVGDRLAIANPGDTSTANRNLSLGALAHELGHSFHLPHPWDNAEDAGPADSGTVFRLMGNGFRQYPNCILTSYELVRMTQPSNPPWLDDGNDAGGGGTYVVQPVAYWGSDTASNTTIFDPADGYTLPISASGFRANIDANFLRVRQFFWDRLDGYTFTARPAILHVSSKTTAQVISQADYDRFAFRSLQEVDAAVTAVDMTDPTQLNFLICPITAGNNQNLQMLSGYAPDGTDAAYGQPLIPPLFGCLVRTRGAGTYLGAPSPSAPSSVEGAVVLLAHELAHAFGYSAATQTVGEHTQSFFNILEQFISAGYVEHMVISPTQAALFKQSPFLTYHAARPS